jgi:hypothetical protein
VDGDSVDLTGRRSPGPFNRKCIQGFLCGEQGPELRIDVNSVRFVAPNMAIEVYCIGLRSNTNTHSELIHLNFGEAGYDIINGASDNFVNFGSQSNSCKLFVKVVQAARKGVGCGARSCRWGLPLLC